MDFSDFSDFSNAPSLPNRERIDVGKLKAIFRSTTTSYKYLFLLSLVEHINEAKGPKVELDTITFKMLTTAWHPSVFFNLSFGKVDKINSLLKELYAHDQIKNNFSGFGKAKRNRLFHEIKNLSSENRDLRKKISALQRYVPYRLLSPFLRDYLNGLSDEKKRKATIELSNAHFNDSKPPIYKFSNDGKSIEVHEAWRDYFKDHYPIVRGWIAWEWLSYMQDRNPNTPALSKKLFPPDHRSDLKMQREFWKNVQNDGKKLRCIYSGRELSEFDLDHFIPWSFVVHDQLWNLVPVSKEVNSSKSDCLPDPKYIPRLAEIQSIGLSINKEIVDKNKRAMVDENKRAMIEKKWNKTIEPFLLGLNMETKYLFDRKRLYSAYNETVKPLMELAKSQGFKAYWNCKEIYEKDHAITLVAADKDETYNTTPKN